MNAIALVDVIVFFQRCDVWQNAVYARFGSA
jgi:hypothetical protein